METPLEPENESTDHRTVRAPYRAAAGERPEIVELIKAVDFLLSDADRFSPGLDEALRDLAAKRDDVGPIDDAQTIAQLTGDPTAFVTRIVETDLAAWNYDHPDGERYVQRDAVIDAMSNLLIHLDDPEEFELRYGAIGSTR